MKKLTFIQQYKKFTKGNLPIVALCFFIALGFWVVKSLNKRYNSKIQIPIQFTFNSANIYTKDSIPKAIWIDANSTGWLLLRHKLGLVDDTLQYQIASFFTRSQTVDKENLTRFINNNAKGISVNQILDDNFLLVFENYKSKTLKLDVDKNSLVYSSKLKLNEINIHPDKITLKGPNSLLRKFDDTFVMSLNLDTHNKELNQIYYYHFIEDSTHKDSFKNIKVELIFETK